MNNLIDKAQQDKVVMGLLTVAEFLLGLAVGILISPIKKGLSINTSIASNNGCNNGATKDKCNCGGNCDCDCDDDCDCCCDCDDENCYDNGGATEDVVEF